MFTLIPLPYALEALEPVISAQTLSYHHGKHLQTYIDNLNKLLPASGLEELPLEDIVAQSTGAIFNNAGQVLNHEMYFKQFKSPAKLLSLSSLSGPNGQLLVQIKKQWGSLDTFRTDFEQNGITLFGSGWVWLQSDASGELSIAQYPGADNPVAHGLKPLLTFDVWEHAYYLDYQNRRASHIQALWQIIDWDVIFYRYDSIASIRNTQVS